jgi:deoxyribonuclease V
MNTVRPSHPWQLSSQEAIATQRRLAEQVVLTDNLPPVRYVAGTDVGFEDGGRTTRAVVAVLSYPKLELVEYQLVKRPTNMPYIPGLLSFRECPALLEALAKVQHQPQLLLCDGQGIAHPRRLGIASHLGLLTGIASIGVAKSRLIGSFQPPGANKGDYSLLLDQDETIGAVLRTRPNTQPLFISPGHNISLPTALDWVLRCTTRYKLPETTRWADGIASRRPSFTKQLAYFSAPL